MAKSTLHANATNGDAAQPKREPSPEEREKARKSSIEYYEKNKDDPAFQESNRKRSREWNINNPEKKKERDRVYYLKNRERILASLLEKGPEISAKRRQHRADNLEVEREKGRIRMRAEKEKIVFARENGDPDGIYANYKAINARALRTWRKNNPDQYRTHISNRAARERNAAGSHTQEDIQRIKGQQRNKCAYCRKPLGKKWHIDHIKPISKGGSNEPSNIQLTCVTCNTRKNASDPIDFARKMGKLL